MTRRYGRGPKNERVADSVPRNCHENITVISAIGLRGIIATMTVVGAVDNEVFDAFLRQVLLPEIKANEVVILDNLSVHRSTPIADILASAQASVRYLPPYSPDFSPIENCWSKVKAFLRAKKARSRELLAEALAQALDSITSSDIFNWFVHCGYKASPE
jgi:transposase